jgi:hypothetical protein
LERRAAVDDDAGRGRIVSAPVSRGGNGAGSYGGQSDSKVVMTPDMKMAAKISGISETLYAEQVLRLREAKKNGDHGGQP